ncbi:sensor histidine kinase [Pedosphaera parvula]|nr:ATP-binding protein [Pedosphaera parvula]
MLSSKNKFFPQHLLLDRTIACQVWIWRRRLGAITVLAFWLALIFPCHGEASEAVKTVALAAADPDDSRTNGLGDWIWTEKRLDRQTCQLWKSFEVPKDAVVVHAGLRMTVDNEYTLFLDGRELGRGSEWRELFDYDLTPLISPGRHTIAVKAYNSSSYAGMIFGLRIDLNDGKTIEVKSDQSWRIVPEGQKGWENASRPRDTWTPATVMASLGKEPWWVKPENMNAMPTLYPVRTYFWQTGWFQVTLLIICGVVISFSLRLMAQLALHKKERLLLQRERARIARDIHDDLGSRITQLVLHGEVAQSELPSESDMRGQLDRICQEARNVLSTLDEILWAVNPRRDSLNEFSSYVCAYAEEFLKPTSIQCLFDVDSEASALTLGLPLRRALLMGIKEALNNSVKYSGASELVFQIKCHGKNLMVAVQDNGKGFNLKAIRPGGTGLLNIVQRMQEQGGSCVITSQPGKGCRVEFMLTSKSARYRPLYWLLKPNRVPAQPDPNQNANEASQTNASI